MIKRKVEIIPPNPDDEIFSRDLIIKENGEEERHSQGYREYIEKKGLEYPGYKKDAGYTLAVYLMSIGCLVFQGESTETSVVYLPEAITQRQYDWYRHNKKVLRRIKLAILDKNEFGLNSYDESSLCGERAFDKFRELIEEKEISDYKASEMKKV